MMRPLLVVLLIASAAHQALGRDAADGEHDRVGSPLSCCEMTDAQSIRDRIELYLDDLVTAACGADLPFALKVDKVAAILAALKHFIRTSRSQNPHLREEDMIFLGSIEDNIDGRQWLPGGRLTSKVVVQFEIDLADQFAAHYARYYAVGDDGKLGLDDFREDWAKKIFASFSCLRIPRLHE